MDTLGIDILGVSEVKLAGAGRHLERRIQGDILRRRTENCRSGHHIQEGAGKKSEIVLVIHHAEEEIEEIYEQLERVIGAPKGKENLIVMGGWNGVVGEDREGRSAGQFVLGKQNPAGE
ncbi:craniofacial development protein 2-like [Hetaerina americana]|uniref:craniofacial development protein 2-like n=1 Tax=Hetaerina americana TaxID=62018 RepID=UPI003A7F26CD